MSNTIRMMKLFAGFSGAHGTYDHTNTTQSSVKVEIKKTAKTLRQPVTVELWQKHLDGDRSLGIIPVTETDDVWWGCIDIDKYDLSHTELTQTFKKFDLPLIVCRSKSGGAHAFLFTREPVPASLMMSKLREIASQLGYGDCEIYPKQDRLLVDRGDLGNWLNMPYFDSARGQRYAVSLDGRGLSLDKFLDLAESARLTKSQLSELSATLPSPDNELDEGPPCLQHLASIGVSEGGRNNALFAYGVLAKKKYPDQWEKKVEEWNIKFLKPPLPSTEVGIILKSLRKKDYVYRCKDQPLVTYCNAAACRGRKFGVGAGGATPAISSISILKIDPPLFFVSLEGMGTVECSSEQLLSSRSFQVAALEQLRVVLPSYKHDTWLNHVQRCMDQAVEIEAPREAGTEGAFQELLETFCTDRHAAKDRDEILLGKPWLDEESERYYFRLSDLQRFLDQHRFREYSRSQITTRIRNVLNGGDQFFNLRGRGVNTFWVPQSVFEVQMSSHKIPRVEADPI